MNKKFFHKSSESSSVFEKLKIDLRDQNSLRWEIGLFFGTFDFNNKYEFEDNNVNIYSLSSSTKSSILKLHIINTSYVD